MSRQSTTRKAGPIRRWSAGLAMAAMAATGLLAASPAPAGAAVPGPTTNVCANTSTNSDPNADVSCTPVNLPGPVAPSGTYKGTSKITNITSMRAKVPGETPLRREIPTLRMPEALIAATALVHSPSSTPKTFANSERSLG